MLLVVECQVSVGSLPSEARWLRRASWHDLTFARTLQQATEQYLSLQPGHRYFAPPASAHTVQSFADGALFVGCCGPARALCGAVEDATAVDVAICVPAIDVDVNIGVVATDADGVSVGLALLGVAASLVLLS